MGAKNTKPHQSISYPAIDTIVDDFMKDSAINNPLLPDFVERSIYRNVLKLMLALMARVLDSSSVGFLGHRISMNLEPDADAVADVEVPDVERL